MRGRRDATWLPTAAPAPSSPWSPRPGSERSRRRWSSRFGTEEYGDGEHPFLATDAASWLADSGVVLVGIDSVNIDDTRGGRREVHTLLLDREVPVVEHLTGLDELPASGATFSAVPPKVAGMSTFPVRAFATLPD